MTSFEEEDVRVTVMSQIRLRPADARESQENSSPKREKIKMTGQYLQSISGVPLKL
jgi:hypothetical protein